MTDNADTAAPQTITNLRDLCDYIGAEEPRLLNHRLYKDTDCGASISLYFDWRDPLHNGDSVWDSLTFENSRGVIGFTIQTIVEGSDATVDSVLFEFPVAADAVDAWIKEMEDEADRLSEDVQHNDGFDDGAK